MRFDLREALKGLGDLERVIARTSCGTASPKDLVALKSSLERLPKICEILDNVNALRLCDLKANLDLGSLSEVAELVERSISSDPPATIREGGIIRDGYDAELDDLRLLLREGRGRITRLEKKERDRTGVKSLTLNGEALSDGFIPADKLAGHNQVEVVLG